MRFAYKVIKMNKLYQIAGAAILFAAAEGCTHDALFQAGMVSPVNSQQEVASAATVGAGHRATLPNGVQLTTTVEYDSTEDTDGPVTLTSRNLATRFAIGKRLNSAGGSVDHVVNASMLLRRESPHLSAPGLEEDLDPVDLFGVGIGYEAQFGKGFAGARYEALTNSENADAILSVYAGIGF